MAKRKFLIVNDITGLMSIENIKCDKKKTTFHYDDKNTHVKFEFASNIDNKVDMFNVNTSFFDKQSKIVKSDLKGYKLIDLDSRLKDYETFSSHISNNTDALSIANSIIEASLKGKSILYGGANNKIDSVDKLKEAMLNKTNYNLLGTESQTPIDRDTFDTIKNEFKAFKEKAAKIDKEFAGSKNSEGKVNRVLFELFNDKSNGRSLGDYVTVGAELSKNYYDIQNTFEDAEKNVQNNKDKVEYVQNAFEKVLDNSTSDQAVKQQLKDKGIGTVKGAFAKQSLGFGTEVLAGSIVFAFISIPALAPFLVAGCLLSLVDNVRAFAKHKNEIEKARNEIEKTFEKTKNHDKVENVRLYKMNEALPIELSEALNKIVDSLEKKPFDETSKNNFDEARDVLKFEFKKKMLEHNFSIDDKALAKNDFKNCAKFGAKDGYAEKTFNECARILDNKFVLVKDLEDKFDKETEKQKENAEKDKENDTENNEEAVEVANETPDDTEKGEEAKDNSEKPTEKPENPEEKAETPQEKPEDKAKNAEKPKNEGKIDEKQEPSKEDNSKKFFNFETPNRKDSYIYDNEDKNEVVLKKDMPYEEKTRGELNERIKDADAYVDKQKENLEIGAKVINNKHASKDHKLDIITKAFPTLERGIKDALEEKASLLTVLGKNNDKTLKELKDFENKTAILNEAPEKVLDYFENFGKNDKNDVEKDKTDYKALFLEAQGKLDELNDKNKELNDKNKELNDKNSELISKNNDLNRENKDLNKINSDLDRENKALNKENENLSEKNNDLNKENKELNDINKGLADKNKDLTEQNKDLTEQNKDLFKENKDLNRENKDLSDKNKDLNEKNANLSTKNDNLENKIAKVLNDLEHAKDKIDSFAEKNNKDNEKIDKNNEKNVEPKGEKADPKISRDTLNAFNRLRTAAKSFEKDAICCEVNVDKDLNSGVAELTVKDYEENYEIKQTYDAKADKTTYSFGEKSFEIEGSINGNNSIFKQPKQYEQFVDLIGKETPEVRMCFYALGNSLLEKADTLFSGGGKVVVGGAERNDSILDCILKLKNSINDNSIHDALDKIEADLKGDITPPNTTDNPEILEKDIDFNNDNFDNSDYDDDYDNF